MIQEEAFTLDLCLKIMIAVMLTIRYVWYYFTCSKKQILSAHYRYVIFTIDVIFVVLYIFSMDIVKIIPKINGLVIMAAVHFYVTVVLPSFFMFFCVKPKDHVESEASSVPDSENQLENRVSSSVQNGK